MNSIIISLTAVFTSGAAALLCGVLYRARDGSASLPGCGGDDSGCDSVLQSRWAWWGPLPVSVLGAVMNGAVCSCLMVLLVWAGAPLAVRWVLWWFLVASVPVLVGAGLWFIVIQAIALRRFCLYCTVVHVLGFITAGLIAVLLSAFANEVWAVGFAPWIAGIAGAMGMIGVQVLWRPKLYEVSAVEGAFPKAPERETALESSQSRLSVSRQVNLIGGKVSVSVGDWPILGSPDAENVFIYFFDYTCENCRLLHSMLNEIISQDRSLAVLLIPIPGEPVCNPHISRRDPNHENACGLARLALVVWGSNPSGFLKYDQFIFAGERPPALSGAVTFAQGLVREKLFDPSIPDPTVDPLLQKGIALFHSLNLSKTPALVLRTGVLRGSVATLKELAEIFEKDRTAYENYSRQH